MVSEESELFAKKWVRTRGLVLPKIILPASDFTGEMKALSYRLWLEKPLGKKENQIENRISYCSTTKINKFKGFLNLDLATFKQFLRKVSKFKALGRNSCVIS